MGLIDRYEVLKHLGRGASGDVVLARDRVLGGREVALKTIRARVDELLRAAFEREFSTMASLSVPGVAQVYDFGVMPAHDGQPGGPFFTRTYIDGLPLDAAAASLELPARLRLFLKVARVIAPLHRAGVLHGDIKPSNAIIDAHGQAWLIDFGLSRSGGPATGQDAQGSAGTPTFMAPELLRGERASVAAEIYALGVTLWQLVAGTEPFAGHGPRALSAKLDGRTPDLPSGLAPLARSALEIARRAISPHPLDRYPSVDELSVSLERLLAPTRESNAPLAQSFVLPRPRGHASTIAALEAFVARGHASDVVTDSVSHVALVEGPPGAGKSLLLRELKWRLQLRSRLVIEVFAGRSGGVLPLISMIEQLALALGADQSEGRDAQALLAALRGNTFDEPEVARTLATLLAAVGRDADLVLLIDDLDQAEVTFGAVLRSAIHAELPRGVCVVASAEGASGHAVRALQVDRVFPLPRLSPQDVATLVTEALGPVDASVVDALVEHAQGLPGALIAALYDLSALSGITPADVQSLASGAAALALARARLSRIGGIERGILEVLALLGSLSRPQAGQALSALGLEASHAQVGIARLETAALVSVVGESFMLSDRTLRNALVTELGAEGQARIARQLLAAELGATLEVTTRAQLAVMAQDIPLMHALVPTAARRFSQGGAHAACADLLTALLSSAKDALRRQTLLSLAQERHALGEEEAAASYAQTLVADAQASAAERADAAVTLARALTALGRFEDAVAGLQLVPSEVDAGRRACVQRELAKVHLRRGDYDAVAQAVELGLSIAPTGAAARIELLCSKGMVASYRSRHAEARACHEEALQLARAHSEKGDEAKVLAYLAIGAQRSGDMMAARDLLAQSLEIARGTGDVGNMATYSMNLGAVLFYLGEPAAAREHYESASRLARRAGRSSTHAQARNNLAHIHLYFGLYERAREEIEEVLRDAEAAGHKFIAAQATALLADLLARLAKTDQALIRYDDAIARYTKLGQTREVAEHHLDAAEALVDRGGPVDASAAAARLAQARDLVEREQLEDLRLRMELLVARTRLLNGDAEAASQTLTQVAARAAQARDRDVEWSALSALSIAHELLGAPLQGRRHARAAAEVLEDIALRVPREHREAFWHDPRRRAVKQRVRAAEARADLAREPSEPHAPSSGAHAERERLLEIIKRLASEHDLDRLLERITESAVDLSGAERGSVLLLDPSGNLMPHVTRLRAASAEDAHVAFSRSIAEAVLIDGEPIVTVDATADGRLTSYVSVHKLMLRSVACLPIQGRAGTVGVLYLEHRRARGRFDESSVDLLCAFADQAAIAIENARLLAEVRAQKDELEQKNAELSHAKGELEDLLLARTRQLDDVQRELTRATQKTSGEQRHGIVGRSAAMRRVFEAIDRLAVASVPVVIRGESGTGKELVARGIHYGGPRANAPFVAINCGSLPENLLESELFGHVKGAFSGADRDKRGMLASASGGTLFLDEASDMPPKMQVDLLRVLQEGKVCRVGSEVEEPIDVRVLAATQKPLLELVAAGRFREDLYYRLNVVELALPALRERREDIPLLCEHFLRAFAARESAPRRHLTRAALARLTEQAWPGNVRQLEHALVQACVMADGTSIDERALALGEGERVAAPPAPVTSEAAIRVENLEDHRLAEKQRILAALESCGWNRVRAAQALGMPRRTFYRRLADYSIL